MTEWSGKGKNQDDKGASSKTARNDENPCITCDWPRYYGNIACDRCSFGDGKANPIHPD